nr:hypothetical protein [Lysobacter enzymogenes]
MQLQRAQQARAQRRIALVQVRVELRLQRQFDELGEAFGVVVGVELAGAARRVQFQQQHPVELEPGVAAQGFVGGGLDQRGFVAIQRQRRQAVGEGRARGGDVTIDDAAEGIGRSRFAHRAGSILRGGRRARRRLAGDSARTRRARVPLPGYRRAAAAGAGLRVARMRDQQQRQPPL